MQKTNFRLWPSVGMMLLVLASLLGTYGIYTTHAATSGSILWHQSFNTPELTTLSNNTGVYAGSCLSRSEFIGNDYDAGQGSLNWSVPNTTNPLPCSNMAIDADSNLYSNTINYGNQPSTYGDLAKYTNGQLVWDVTPPHNASVVAVQLGADGNIYAITTDSSNNLYLLGVAPDVANGQITPSVLVDAQIAPGSSGLNLQATSAWQNGLAIKYTNGDFQYIEYNGSTNGVVAIPNVGITSSFAAGMSGRVFVPIKASAASAAACPTQTNLTVDSNIAAYDPSGALWSYTLPACTAVHTLLPTPDDGVVAVLSTDNGITPSTRNLLSLISNGTQRWPSMVQLPYTYNGTTYLEPDLFVTTNGDVAIAQSYVQADNNRGELVYLDSGTTGSRSFSYDFVPSPLTGGYNLGVFGSFAIANNTVYLALTFCSYSSNGSTSQCGGITTLYAVNAPGMSLDYPRGAILAPPACPTLQFIGVRGSGETSADYDGYGETMAAMKDTLLKQFPSMGSQAIDYPAVEVLQGGLKYGSVYLASVGKGTTTLANYIYQFTKTCSTTHLILAGYSQGAQVVGDAFAMVTAFPNIAKLISAVIMFGDPRFNPKQSKVDFGPYDNKLSGSFQKIDPHMRQIPSKFVPIVHSYCLLGDPVCNLSKENLKTCLASLATCSHLLYWNGWAEIGAEWVASLVA